VSARKITESSTLKKHRKDRGDNRGWNFVWVAGTGLKKQRGDGEGQAPQSVEGRAKAAEQSPEGKRIAKRSKKKGQRTRR